MNNLKLGAIIIGVHDLEISCAFYTHTCGFTIEKKSPHFISGKIGDIAIEIEEDAPYRFPDWTSHHVGTYKNVEFYVDDIMDFIRRWVKYGGIILTPPKHMPWGSINAEIIYIDGNIFPISQQSMVGK